MREITRVVTWNILYPTDFFPLGIGETLPSAICLHFLPSNPAGSMIWESFAIFLCRHLSHLAGKWSMHVGVLLDGIAVQREVPKELSSILVWRCEPKKVAQRKATTYQSSENFPNFVLDKVSQTFCTFSTLRISTSDKRAEKMVETGVLSFSFLSPPQPPTNRTY